MRKKRANGLEDSLKPKNTPSAQIYVLPAVLI